MVTFSTEVDPRSIPLASQLMTGIVPWQTWQKRVAGLQAEIKSNPYWETFLLDRHGLELGFGTLKRRLQTTNRVPWPIKTSDEYKLYSFLAIAVRVYANLTPGAQMRFAGGIRSGLEKEFGLGPLAFEMTMAAYLMSAGFDIEFHDLESGGGYDFLASRGSSQVEVECKFISADIGRQIHRRRLYDLGGVLFPASGRRERVMGVRLVRVKLSGRLTSNKQHQTDLSERIWAVIRDPTTLIDDGICSVAVEDFVLEDSPFTAERGDHVTMDDIRKYLDRVMNIDQSHTLLNWQPGHGAIIVDVKSRKPDRVLDEIFKNLKDDARRQFSRALPAFLCVHLADVTKEQLQELAYADRAGTVTGLQKAASILLQIRPHLHSIAFMTNGEVTIARRTTGGGVGISVHETGPSYVFKNPDHPMANEPALRAFL